MKRKKIYQNLNLISNYIRISNIYLVHVINNKGKTIFIKFLKIQK